MKGSCYLLKLLSVLDACVECKLDTPTECAMFEAIRICGETDCAGWPYRIQALDAEYPDVVLDRWDELAGEGAA